MRVAIAYRTPIGPIQASLIRAAKEGGMDLLESSPIKMAHKNKLFEPPDGKKWDNYDVIMAARSSFVSYVEFLCCLRKYMEKPLVMDFDDHFLGVPDYNTGYVTNHPNSRVAKAARIQLTVSDAATTTTEKLFDPSFSKRENISTVTFRQKWI